MKESIEQFGRAKKTQNLGLTQKKLQFLLPSSKQILLVNSSIRYNTLNTYSEEPVEKVKPSPAPISLHPQNKENCLAYTKTSIMRIEDPISESLEHINEPMEESAAQMKEKSLKILAQTYNHLNTPAVASKAKAFSSVHFPAYELHQMTSLNNIVPGPDSDPEPKPDSGSKKELLARIANLQSLVRDIISGKVAIAHSRSQRRLPESPSKRETIMQLGQKFQRREKRSATWSKDPGVVKMNKSMRFDKSKLKIENPIVQRREEYDSKQKGFIIKKKGNLKLDNYKPIREAESTEKRTNALKASLNAQESERPSKLKLRVNFMPNIINL